jgi:hypothetical protein
MVIDRPCNWLGKGINTIYYVSQGIWREESKWKAWYNLKYDAKIDREETGCKEMSWI